jgi:hypothetical protein
MPRIPLNANQPSASVGGIVLPTKQSKTKSSRAPARLFINVIAIEENSVPTPLNRIVPSAQEAAEPSAAPTPITWSFKLFRGRYALSFFFCANGLRSRSFLEDQHVALGNELVLFDQIEAVIV